MHAVLVISTIAEDIAKIRSALDQKGRLDEIADIAGAIENFKRTRYDLIFIDLDILLKQIEGEDFDPAMKEFQRQAFPGEIVVVTAPVHIRKAVGLFRQGVSDYITSPISTDEIRLLVEKTKKIVLRNTELDYLRDQFWKADAMEVVQTKSAAMVEVFNKIRSVAATKTTVLLNGETGTGKSLLAKLIHQHSNRQKAQFISVHCGAIPDTLLESELFGHERGAFTGALRKKAGKFEIANGGTIFLDEIGTLTPQAQIKLLQVLQDGTFSHVGGEETLHSNARVIAATNSDLKKMNEDGAFRKDLFYRLNVFPIHIPPLSHRIEDLPQLMASFLKRLNRENQKTIHSIHPLVIQCLSRYYWPGNVRELENLMERAHILETSQVLTPAGFPQELFEGHSETYLDPAHGQLPLAEARRRVINDFERNYIKELLRRNNGKINKSAVEAGISTRQLNKLMGQYGLFKEDYKTKI